MPKQIPAEELNEIVTLVASYPGGVGVEPVRRDLTVALAERSLQRRLALLASVGRIVARGTGKGRRYFPAQQEQPDGRRGGATTAAPSGTSDADQAPEDHTKTPTRFVHRKARPRVLLALPGAEERQVRAILSAAHEWEWDVLDIVLTRGYIPSDPAPAGAIVDCLPTAPLAIRLRGMGLSVVRLGWMPHKGDHELPAVLPDHAAVGRLAARHFAERGFKHVAYENSVPRLDARPMEDALIAEARKHQWSYARFQLKRPPPTATFTQASADEHERRARAIGHWVAGLPKPVGILSPSASSVCTICQRQGIAVPEAAALLGVGNHLLACEMSPVRLSSVDTAVEEQGRQAAHLLHRLMAGETPPGGPLVIAPRGVVTRQSTDVLAVADPAVAQALRYMWDHLALDLSVADVAGQVGVSERSLQRAFRQHLERGIIAELQRKRVEELALLLRTTQDPVADLAPRVGFRTLTHMHKCFRATYGMTPRQFRNRHRAS